VHDEMPLLQIEEAGFRILIKAIYELGRHRKRDLSVAPCVFETQIFERDHTNRTTDFFPDLERRDGTFDSFIDHVDAGSLVRSAKRRTLCFYFESKVFHLS
jgi:hypothetical protein